MSEQVKRYRPLHKQVMVYIRETDYCTYAESPGDMVLASDFDALAQRCRELESQHGSWRMVLDLQISMLRDERDAIEGERDTLRATITAARDKLGPAVRAGHPALTELAAAEALELLEAACADTTGDTPAA